MIVPIRFFELTDFLLWSQKLDPDVTVRLLEYDKRFEQYGSDFIYYDYNQPDGLPLELTHSFQVIVADPPYLVSKGTIWFLLFPCFPSLLTECLWYGFRVRSAWRRSLRQCLSLQNRKPLVSFYSLVLNVGCFRILMLDFLFQIVYLHQVFQNCMKE